MIEIQNIHGGVLYVRLAERHGSNQLPNQISKWAETDANWSAARKLADRKLIKILNSSLEEKISDIKSAPTPTAPANSASDSFKLSADTEAQLRSRAGLPDSASEQKLLDVAHPAATTLASPPTLPGPPPSKAPGFNFGSVSSAPKKSSTPPEGFNYGVA